MPPARLADSWRMRSLPSGAGKVAGVQGGDGGVPVDGGHRGAAADAAGDEPGSEVVAVQKRAVADEQFGACFEGVEAGGAGPECGGDRPALSSSSSTPQTWVPQLIGFVVHVPG
jgi:hypothetical protein